MPAPPPAPPPPATDSAPPTADAGGALVAAERVTSLEAKLDQLLALSGAPAQSVLAPLMARLDALEASEARARESAAQAHDARVVQAARLGAEAAVHMVGPAVAAPLSQLSDRLLSAQRQEHAQLLEGISQRMGASLSASIEHAVRSAVAPVVAEMAAATAEMRQRATSLEGAATSLEQSASSADARAAAHAEALALPSLAERLSERVATAVTPVVSAAVASGMSELSAAADALPAAVSAPLVAGVSTHANAAFKEHFVATLVPGFERATQSMYAQLHEAMSGGMSQISAEWKAPCAALAEQCAAHEARMADSAAALERALTATRSSPPPRPTRASPTPASAAAIAMPAPPAPPTATPPAAAAAGAQGGAGLIANFGKTMELQRLVNQGQIEQAFVVALSMQV